jgi:hypothetical protein
MDQDQRLDRFLGFSAALTGFGRIHLLGTGVAGQYLRKLDEAMPGVADALLSWQPGMEEAPPSNTVPFKIGESAPPPGTKNPYPEYDLSVPNKFRSSPLPPEITQALIDDPAVMLRAALQGQKLTKIIRLITNTSPGGGVENIPFLVANAEAPSLESVFAIETVQDSSDSAFLQLQYAQTTLLNFNGMSFPHVTVGTLIKAF